MYVFVISMEAGHGINKVLLLNGRERITVLVIKLLVLPHIEVTDEAICATPNIDCIITYAMHTLR